MADITIGFDSSYPSDSTNNLERILEKLEEAVSKFADAANRYRNTASTDTSYTGSNSPFAKISKDFQDAVEKFNNAQTQNLRLLGSTIRESLGVGLVTGAAIGASRYLNAEAGAIVSRGATAGSFAAAGIEGNANQQFGNYVGSLYSIDRIRQIAEHSGKYEAIFGGIGTGLGFLAGGLASDGLAAPEGGVGGKLFGRNLGRIIDTIAGGSVGYSAGNYAAAAGNAKLEEYLRVQGALAARDANAATSEYRTGFSRFGLATQSVTLANSELTGGAPISVNLAGEFEKRYGNSQNYNQILNNIVPYLNTNPLDNTKTGNLDKVAENFLKAGFAANQFAELTVSGSKYAALTGENLQKFSENLKNTRANFGDAFDSSTLATSLNLIALGYNKDDANNLAFQSKFNSGLASNLQAFNSLGYVQSVTNQAIGQSVGLDLNRSLELGKLVGTSGGIAELNKELDAFHASGGKDYGRVLELLNVGAGITPDKLFSLRQSRVIPSGNKGSTGDADLSPGQAAAQQIIDTIKNGFNGISSMNVTASIVNINGGNDNSLFSNNSTINRLEHAAVGSLPIVGHLFGAFDPTKK